MYKNNFRIIIDGNRNILPEEKKDSLLLDNTPKAIRYSMASRLGDFYVHCCVS